MRQFEGERVRIDGDISRIRVDNGKDNRAGVRTQLSARFLHLGAEDWADVIAGCVLEEQDNDLVADS